MRCPRVANVTAPMAAFVIGLLIFFIVIVSFSTLRNQPLGDRARLFETLCNQPEWRPARSLRG
jgi:hypothetical protein